MLAIISVEVTKILLSRRHILNCYIYWLNLLFQFALLYNIQSPKSITNELTVKYTVEQIYWLVTTKDIK